MVEHESHKLDVVGSIPTTGIHLFYYKNLFKCTNISFAIKRDKMTENLSSDKVKGFFQEFYEKYKAEAQKVPNKEKLILLNSSPVKFELLFDRDMSYCIAVLSKAQSSSFHIESSYEDPMIVVAVANSKKSQYGRDFLYHFQLNSARFPSWDVSEFTKDFINYEIVKNNIDK